jgi:hypothetical protein
MIDSQSSACRTELLADRARAALLYVHRIVLRDRDTKVTT